MIIRLEHSKNIDFLEFIKQVPDNFQDFYITKNKTRIFLTDLKLITKILNSQEVYALYEGEIKGILILFKEKGFRPYVKLLAENYESQSSLIKYLIWNFSTQDLFFKLKKTNPLTKHVQKYGWVFSGDRGQEILLFRKGIKSISKLGEKDDDRNNNEA